MNKAFNKVIKSHVLLTALTVVAVVLLASGVTYSLYQIENKNEKNQSIAVGDLNADISSITGAIILNDLYPESSSKITDDSKKYTFTLTNSGTFDIKYQVYLKDATDVLKASDKSYSSYKQLNKEYYEFINYKLDGSGAANLESIYENSKFTVLTGTLKAGETEDHYLQFFLDNKDTTVTGAPNDITGSVLSLDIYLDTYVADTITDNIIASASEELPNNNDDGVFKTLDDYGTSYYFRGNVNNNYVAFANYIWRIVRINGDGTMRIMFDGTYAHENGDASDDRVIRTNTEWNTEILDNKYSGYMYGTSSKSKEQAQSNLTNSNIKSILDEWYKENILNKGFNDYVADRIYCNDRSTSNEKNVWMNNDSALGFDNNVTAYGAFSRFNNADGTWKDVNTSSFTCPNVNDSFSTSLTKGNGNLNYPIGLLSFDELVAITSTNANTPNVNSYVFKGYAYWTMTPSHYNDGIYIYELDEAGAFNKASGDSKNAVVPVINLTSDYTSKMLGTGTIIDPYRVAE